MGVLSRLARPLLPRRPRHRPARQRRTRRLWAASSLRCGQAEASRTTSCSLTPSQGKARRRLQQTTSRQTCHSASRGTASSRLGSGPSCRDGPPTVHYNLEDAPSSSLLYLFLSSSVFPLLASSLSHYPPSHRRPHTPLHTTTF